MKRIFYVIIFLNAGYLSAYAQLVTTYAGTGDTNSQPTGGTSKLLAHFDQPYGIAIDSKNNMWVTEESGCVVKVILGTPYGGSYVWDRAGAYQDDCFHIAYGTASRLDGPRGIAVGPGDTIYIADANNHVIRKMDPLLGIGSSQNVGVLAGWWSSPGPGNPNCLTDHPGYKDTTAAYSQFNYPSGVFATPSNDVYVADMGNHCIRKISNGWVTTVAGGPNKQGYLDGSVSVAKFNYPTGVYVASNGDIYVADRMNSKIRKISGGQVTTVDTNCFTPETLILDSINSIYFTDQHRIKKLVGTNTSTYAGYPTNNFSGLVNAFGTNARFRYVRGIIKDKKNSYVLYTADQDNNLIREITICQDFSPQITVTGKTMLCVGDSTTLMAPAGYSKYQWSTGSTKQSIVVKTSGAYSVTVILPDSCRETSSSINISLFNPNPKITYNTPTNFCEGDSVILMGPSGKYHYIWTTGDTTQNITVKKSDSIRLTLSNGICAVISSPVLTKMLKRPTAIFSFKTPVCVYSNDTITYSGSGSSQDNYIWSFGSGSNVNSGTGIGPYSVFWSSSGIKNVSLYVIDTNGCTSLKNTINVYVKPAPVASYQCKLAVCANALDTLTYIGSSSSSATYAWDFKGGNLVSGYGQGPMIVKWTTPGYKQPTLIVTDTNGCSSLPATQTIKINSIPSSQFTTFTEIYVKDTNRVEALYTSSTANYTWDLDSANIIAGSGSGPVIFKWALGGIKTISLTVEDNGCSSTTYQDIIVDDSSIKPNAGFVSNLTQIGKGGKVTFIDASANFPNAWKWSFPGGSPVSSNSNYCNVIYYNYGTYDVKLIVSNSHGTDSVTKKNYIIVNPPPSADFSAYNPKIYSGGTVAFIDQSLYNPTSWNWTFFGGTPVTSTLQYPPIQYKSPGTYDVKLVVSNSIGKDSVIKMGFVTVYTPLAPVAKFGSNYKTVLEGSAVNFYDSSANLPTSWEWIFSGGTPATSTQTNPTIIYNTQGTYDVSLVVQNIYGKDSIAKINYITVNKPTPPIADFSGNPVHVALGGIANFTDNSSNSPSSWQWTFNGGNPSTSISQNQIVHYNTLGYFDVKLVVSNSYGKDSIYKSSYILVGFPPIAKFGANKTNIITGDTVIFTDSSQYSPTSWKWTFDGGTPNTSINQTEEVLYSATGSYNVKLVVYNSDGCDSLTRTSYIVVGANGIKNIYPTSYLKIYPTIANDHIIAEFPVYDNKPFTILITDINGKVIYNKPSIKATNTIDVSNFSNGLYLLNIIMDQNVYHTKFIKE